MSFIFLCRRKPNRLKAVCFSQMSSLPGSDPSGQCFQKERDAYHGFCELIYHQADTLLEKNRSKLLMLPQGAGMVIWLDAEQRNPNLIRQEDRELRENMEIRCKLWRYHRNFIGMNSVTTRVEVRLHYIGIVAVQHSCHDTAETPGYLVCFLLFSDTVALNGAQFSSDAFIKLTQAAADRKATFTQSGCCVKYK